MGINYQECIRIRPTFTLNSSNRSIKSYPEGITIGGFFGRQKDQQLLINGKWSITTLYNFLCNDFDLKYGDIITYNGNTYEVVSDPKNTANKSHHIKATLKKIENIKQL